MVAKTSGGDKKSLPRGGLDADKRKRGISWSGLGLSGVTGTGAAPWIPNPEMSSRTQHRGGLVGGTPPQGPNSHLGQGVAQSPGLGHDSGGIFHGKSAQVWEREEGVDFPSLEVPRAGLEVALSALGWGSGTAWSSFPTSLILGFCGWEVAQLSPSLPPAVDCAVNP